MGYVVTDGKSRHEFGTLREAVAFRKDVPLPILLSDNLGNMHPVPMAQIAAAVQAQDYASPATDPVPAEKPTIQGHHTNFTFILILATMGVLVALALVWFALRTG